MLMYAVSCTFILRQCLTNVVLWLCLWWEKGLQCSRLTAEAVWETGSLWVGQVWGEYCESAGWKASLLPWLLTSSILLKFSRRRNRERGTTPRVLVTERISVGFLCSFVPLWCQIRRENVHIIAEVCISTHVQTGACQITVSGLKLQLSGNRNSFQSWWDFCCVPFKQIIYSKFLTCTMEKTFNS